MLEMYSYENISQFVIKTVTHKNVLRRMIYFLLMLVFYIVAVNLRLINSWYCFPLLLLGAFSVLGTMNKVVQGNIRKIG